MTPIALFVEYYRPLAQARKSAKAEGDADQATRKDATKDARIRERVVIREAAERGCSVRSKVRASCRK